MEQTWAGALSDVWRSVARHKVKSGVIAFAAVVSLGSIAWAGTSSTTPSAGAPKPAAAFSLPVLGQSGQRVALGDYTGKPLIVNFFAAWCAPCQEETPLIAGFYRGEHGKVPVVGLDENDTMGHALAFTHAKDVTYPVGFDPQFVTSYAYGVTDLPQTFFLNAKHQIVDRVFGAVTKGEIAKGLALATRSAGAKAATDHTAPTIPIQHHDG